MKANVVWYWQSVVGSTFVSLVCSLTHVGVKDSNSCEWIKDHIFERNDGASKENLHFDDQTKQVFSLLFVAMFSKRNR